MRGARASSPEGGRGCWSWVVGPRTCGGMRSMWATVVAVVAMAGGLVAVAPAAQAELLVQDEAASAPGAAEVSRGGAPGDGQALLARELGSRGLPDTVVSFVRTQVVRLGSWLERHALEHPEYALGIGMGLVLVMSGARRRGR